MKLFLNLIPALAYALVTFFSNITGLTSEVAKSPEKKQLVSQSANYQENVRDNNFVWTTTIEQTVALNQDRDTRLAQDIPYPLNGMNRHSSLLIRRYILSAYATN